MPAGRVTRADGFPLPACHSSALTDRLASLRVSQERSRSGQPVYRHEQAAEPAHSTGDPELIAAVDAHVTAHFGAPSTVWHEVVSPYVHVDVHVVAPTDERPVFTLVTSGMGERPMASSSGDRYAELMMVLPPTWPSVGSEGFRHPAGHWPYKLLQDLAQLPHQFNTTLWTGHTVPNGDPPESYAPDTKLCGALLVPPLIAPEQFGTLRVGERVVHFLAVIPLHRDEMQLKLDHGLDALFDFMDEANITEILHADRPSVIPRRRRLFRR
jgi:Suppressor of fused protein (SUFU)